ncbi:GH16804 [Drosophila grimshawi]|uniref:GH16804 n=1 Tax=Drosophila grimshawi TaxID=7222 RepID=B4IWT6_DROGR|nr:GH16804 [Drosophila grimshawi]
MLINTISAKEIKKCAFGDDKCMVDSINNIIKNYPKGIPEIGLKPIDLVDVPDLKLVSKNHENEFFYADINLTNQVNYGFENTTITSVEGFTEDPTSTNIIISGSIPSLVHKGLYMGDGRLWIIKVNLTGESTSEFQKMDFTLKLKVSLQFRNNKRYLKIHELSPTVSLKRWILWMDSLFPDNSDLTIRLNRLFNERWVEIWNEWEPMILDAFAEVFLNQVKDIFDRVPYDDMFLSNWSKTRNS